MFLGSASEGGENPLVEAVTSTKNKIFGANMCETLIQELLILFSARKYL